MHSSEMEGEAMVLEAVEGTEGTGLETGRKAATATKTPEPETRKIR